MIIGDMVYVNPTWDHIGGYGMFLGSNESSNCYIEFWPKVIFEIPISDIECVCC